jgi:Lamin Tail Domain/LysM domain
MIEQQRPKQKSRLFPMLLFLVLVFIVALGGTFLGMQLFGSNPSEGRSGTIPQVITVEVIITTTPNPSPQVIVITATNQAGQVELPDGLAVANNVSGVQPGATIDPANLGASGANVDTAAQVAGTNGTTLPENCILHSIVDGATPFGIAEQYGANPFLLLEANNLTEDTAALLQIGDTLIVPLEGCPVELPPTETPIPPPSNTPDPDSATATAEATEELAFEFTPTITPSPTITLAPTAENAQIEIVDVEGIGDITAEGIRLRNTGNTINVTGWKLTDANGNEFLFPEQLLFSNAEVTIYTRNGTNTPVALFWGLDDPVWEEGDVLTLTDSTEQVQANLRLPEEINLE